MRICPGENSATNPTISSPSPLLEEAQAGEEIFSSVRQYFYTFKRVLRDRSEMHQRSKLLKE